jgi:hypothetical protein
MIQKTCEPVNEYWVTVRCDYWLRGKGFEARDASLIGRFASPNLIDPS